MNSTQSLRSILEQALLAQAAYANLQGIIFADDALMVSRLANGQSGTGPVMSLAAATYIADNFGVVHHQSNTASGYSATLFRRRTIGSDDPTGGFVFAQRGTEFSLGSIDLWSANLGIALSGMAIRQRADMLQYWDGLLRGDHILSGVTASELVGRRVNVTGHSLGGNLATWFANDRASALGHAFTFNGAGVAHVDRLNIPGNRISNFVSDAYWDIIETVPGTHYGSADRIFIERSGGVLPGHSMNNQLSGIASYYVLSLIDPTLSSRASSLILHASSSVDQSSFEGFAAALRTTFGRIESATDENGHPVIFGLIRALEAASASPAPPAISRLISIADMSAADVRQRSLATTGEGAALRFALVHSLPFAVEGSLATAYQSSDYAAGNFSYQYLEDRSDYLHRLIGANVGDVQTSVLDPRFAYVDLETGRVLASVLNPPLATMNQVIFGTMNVDAAAALTGGEYNDRIYGLGGNDTLAGGGGNDLLDGGAGNDILIGGPGADILAGGEGNDTYRYFAGDGAMTILDPSGTNSISINFPDRNYVLGTDTIRRISAGVDTWADSRGNRYALAGTTLTIALEDGGSISIPDFASGSFGIMLDDAAPVTPPTGVPTYSVANPGQVFPNQTPVDINTNGAYAGTGNLREWQSAGYWFGRRETEIVNAGEAVEPIYGTHFARVAGGFGDSYINGDAGFNWIRDDGALLQSTGQGGPLGQYELADQVGNDHIEAGAGNDWILTRGGDDTVHAGDGDDVIDNTTSGWQQFNDRAVLYQRGSIVWLSSSTHTSNDQLLGEAGNDYINADGGNQYMDGGADQDELYAGAGDDVLIGGAGNDVLGGDLYLQTSPFLLTLDPSGYASNVTFNGNALVGDLVNYGNDILDGGDGNDTLFGGGGDDILIGGIGDDRLQGDFRSGYSDLRLGLRGMFAEPVSIHGNDNLSGGAGNDVLDGGGGDDAIEGGADDDTIYGGSGDDVIQGGSGVDYIVGDDASGAQGSDTIRGGDQDDTLFGMGGNDLLYGDTGSDTIVGGEGDDLIEGGDGDDYSYFDNSVGLFGGAGNDVLTGGAGKDLLQGGEGNDRLESDSGGDFLYGEAGDDTYAIGLGAGASSIVDNQGANALIFGQGIQVRDVVVTMSGAHAFIDFSDTDYIETFATHFDRFVSVSFADGTTLSNHEFRQLFRPGDLRGGSYIELGAEVASSEIGLVRWNNDLLLTYSGPVSNWIYTNNFGSRNIFFERGEGAAYAMAAGVQVVALTNWFLGNPSIYANTFIESGGTQFNFASAAASAASTLAGDNGDDVLTALQSGSTLLGAGGDDVLSGLGGNDDLSGGQGQDLLVGGAGNDTYHYAIGDGADIIIDEGGQNDVLRLATGIAVGDLTITEQADGLHLQVGAPANGDEILITNWSGGSATSIDQIVFADSSTLDRGDIDLLNIGNHSPRTLEEIGRLRAPVGQAFAFTIPSTAIGDADAGDTLTFQAGMVNPLPAWLTFDAVTGTFSGTPVAGSEGLINVDIRTTDSGGLSTVTTFQLDVPSTYTGTSSGDYLTAQGANSAIIYGLDGDDTLMGAIGNDELYGGAGHDDLEGGNGSDYLDGGIGDDRLNGGNGADIFLAGIGADFIHTLESGADATDTIRVFMGDGTDEMIIDYLGDNDVIEFGPGITAQYVLANAYITANGYWVIPYNPNNATDRLEIRNYEAWTDSAQDVRTIGTTLRFSGGEQHSLSEVFADMNVLTTGNDTFVASGSSHIDALSGDDLILVEGSVGLSVDGNAGNDILDGSNSSVGVVLDGGTGNDHLMGTQFVDELTGGDGDDLIESNSGDDVLDGGNGNDVYLRDQFYGAPGEVLTVTDAGGWDTLESGLRLSKSTFSRVGDDLSISQTIGGATSAVVVEGWYLSANRRIERIEFTTGVSSFTDFYTADQIEGLVTGTNTAPAVTARMEDVGATIGQSFSQFYSADNAIDSQTDYGSLIRTVHLADGSPLPSWLTYSQQIFSGTPGAGDAGELRIVIESADPGGLSVSDEFTIVVGSGLVFGNNNNNTYNGSSSANIYFGRNGNDTLNGNGGNDQLYGGLGNDTISGGDGDDILVGGPGSDTLIGGIGTNIYRLDPEEGTDTHAMSTTGTHRFQFGAGISSADIAVGMIAATDGSVSMRIRYYDDAPNDVLQIKNVFMLVGNDLQLNSNAGAYTFEFRGGAQLTISQLIDLAPSSPPTAGDDLLLLTSAATIDGSSGADVIIGSASADQLYGGTGQDRLYAMAGTDTLYGGDGNDLLSGGLGADTMTGGEGNDTYIVEDAGDVVVEGPGYGSDSVQSSLTYVLGANLENLTLTQSAAINGTGNAFANVITGNGANNILIGLGGADTLNGGTGVDTADYSASASAVTINLLAGTGSGGDAQGDTLIGVENIIGSAFADSLTGSAANNTMTGGQGNDVYHVDASGDTTIENANEGVDTVNSSVTRTLAANIELLFLTGTTAINGTGNSLSNLLRGNGVNNTLSSAGGIDILEGGAGNDILSNTTGKSLLNGGTGTDTLTGTSSNDLLIGGGGNDALTTGSGADIIVFNLGEGQDTVASSTTRDNTLSLGGGAVYADLLFQKSGNNLVLKVGATDQITFTNYYSSTSNRSVNNLQVVIEGTSDYDAGSVDATRNKKIETFNFEGLVTAFDAARVANPGLTSWALTNALLTQHLSGSDSAALGGDLAYRYNRFGTLSDLSFTPASGILATGTFGSSAQALQSLTSLQDASARLS